MKNKGFMQALFRWSVFINTNKAPKNEHQNRIIVELSRILLGVSSQLIPNYSKKVGCGG